ncbi:MAG: 2-C-methyl-D-erythritol 4-phosphate cytidylyltransferase [Lachnospiraceae bacterium]|nr:2-C-methyl-D-erythritol 4-phosphate cytidylyltransferase [Lachnospiraceae bacterium]
MEAECTKKTRGRVGAVILAGGQGKRMNSTVQKQYMLLAGRPLLVYALEAFEQSPVDEIVLVTGAGEEDYVMREILAPHQITKVSAVVQGGKERYHSVYAGLLSLHDCDYVLIHDGARPLVDQGIIGRAIAGAVAEDACVVGMPVKDTIKVADSDDYAADTPDRSSLWQVQTPQAFAYPLIRSAYDALMADPALQAGITDDAMVVEKLAGNRIKLIEGSYENLKVTTPEDLVVAEALLKRRAAVSNSASNKKMFCN